jgi:tRNA G46 methylase TrmB
MSYFHTINYQPQFNPARLKWDIQQNGYNQFDSYWAARNRVLIDPAHFKREEPVWLEIGAGTGGFFEQMAKHHPDRFLIAIERCKVRAQALTKRITRAALPNLVGYRGNAVPALIHGVPTASVERLYILYPCPWPKNSQRRNRWYLHPIMPHLVRSLKNDGLLIWASDQKFYIDEARFVCESIFGMRILAHGEIQPNAYNSLEFFEGGRTKFERTFLESGQPCYELVAQPASPLI